jgi:hypothetical protein
VTDRVELTAELPHVTETQQQTLAALSGRITRLRTAMDMMNGTWRKGWSPDALTHEYQVGDRLTYFPDRAIEIIDDFQAQWPTMISEVTALQREGVDQAAIASALSHLGVDQQMKAAAK